LARTPFASLMTIAVIGVALALPSGLYVLIENVQHVSGGIDSSARISVFLKKSISDDRAEHWTGRVRKIPGVVDAQYVPPKEALAEFKRLSGFGDAVDTLDNPLPGVVLVTPAVSAANEASLNKLVERLKKSSEVDLVQLDFEWVQRLNALLEIAQRAATLLAVVLAASVLLIIGNTIRLAVYNRRDEIEVIKLIGGTSAFIRRPFLYSGALQGLFGALAAWLLIQLSLSVVAGPVGDLALLYGSDFRVKGLNLAATGALLLTGTVLGWFGSRVAVGRHLAEIEPS
jgi:cell division transport system permease protein